MEQRNKVTKILNSMLGKMNGFEDTDILQSYEEWLPIWGVYDLLLSSFHSAYTIKDLNNPSWHLKMLPGFNFKNLNLRWKFGGRKSFFKMF